MFAVSFYQANGDFSTFKHQKSFTASVPVLPPKVTKNGFVYERTCPYLLPGVVPTTGTTFQNAFYSPFLISNKYKSSEANPPPI